MARLPKIDPATLTDEQKPVYDRIASGPRGVVRGPLAVWLRRPGLAARAEDLGKYCRYDSSLNKQLSELAILVTARAWGSEFEWFAHKKHALDAGVSPEIVEAIRTTQTPVISDPEQRAVLGEGRLIDLIGVLGYYSLVSMTINAFDVDVPDGNSPELDS